MMKFVLVIASFLSLQAFANDVIKVENARVFIPFKGRTMTAGYGEVKNLTDKEIVLKIVKDDKFKAIELHESYKQDGKMGMRRIEEFKIPANGELNLKPGGHHLMFFNPVKELTKDEKVNITFNIDGKETTIAFPLMER